MKPLQPPPNEVALLYYDDVIIIDAPDAPDASEQQLLDALELFLLRACIAEPAQCAA